MKCFFSGLFDGVTGEIDRNVGWAIGGYIFKGSVIVGGNAGGITGVGIF